MLHNIYLYDIHCTLVHCPNTLKIITVQLQQLRLITKCIVQEIINKCEMS